MERITFFKDLMDDLKTAEDKRRGTGRTTAIIDQMQDGDVIIVHTMQCGEQVRNMAAKKGKAIIPLAAPDQRTFDSVMHEQLRGFQGNIYFDHHVLGMMFARKVADFEKMHGIWTMHNKPFGEEKKEQA